MIAAIEKAVLAALQAASDDGDLPWVWGTLETYPEEWDVYLKEKGQISAPAAWVGFLRWDAPDPADQRQRITLRFVLVLMAENLRDEEATRHGDPVDATKPGSYSLLTHSAAILAHNRLGLDIDHIKIGASHPVRPPAALAESKVAFQAVEFSTQIGLDDLIATGGGAAPFTSVHANWDIPILGNVGLAGLPDDAGADATDHIVQEQS